MRIFLIDAYGAPERVDGAIHRFAVQAETAQEAVDLVQESESGRRFTRFDLVETGDEIDADEAEIIGEVESPFSKPASST